MPDIEHRATIMGKTPVIVFKIKKNTKSKRKRAKYNTERRKEVKTVRHNRACLRCALLKIKCNGDAICITCNNLILHTHERQVLSFSACIRTRLAEVGFFEAYVPQHEVRDSILAKAGDLASTVVLDFASKVTWDLKELTNDVVAWLYNPMDSDTSKVGILSSLDFLDLISSTFRDCEKSNFRRMIYAESLAYTQPTTMDKHYLSIPDLRQIGAIAGHEFLKCLDNKLRPQSLKDCSQGDFQALFLMVFGTILATSYTVPPLQDVRPSYEKVEGTPHDLHQLTTRSYHLCQILAHYMFYLGSYLKLPIANNMEHFLLLESAPARWHKKGKFVWSNDEKHESISTGVENFKNYGLITGDHNQATHRHSVPPKGEPDSLIVPPSNYWSVSIRPLPDIPAQSAGTGTKWKADYLSNDGRQLLAEEMAETDQNYLSNMQTMHYILRPRRKRKALDPSERQAAADTRRRSRCSFCHATSRLISGICGNCFPKLRYPFHPIDAVYNFLPPCQTATGHYGYPLAERINAADQETCLTEMTTEYEAEQKRQQNLVVVRLLV